MSSSPVRSRSTHRSAPARNAPASAPAKRSTPSCSSRSELSLAAGAIAPWSGGQTAEYFLRLLEGAGLALGFSVDTPWERLSAAVQKAVLYGLSDQVHVSYRNRYGRDRS